MKQWLFLKIDSSATVFLYDHETMELGRFTNNGQFGTAYVEARGRGFKYVRKTGFVSSMGEEEA